MARSPDQGSPDILSPEEQRKLDLKQKTQAALEKAQALQHDAVVLQSPAFQQRVEGCLTELTQLADDLENDRITDLDTAQLTTAELAKTTNRLEIASVIGSIRLLRQQIATLPSAPNNEARDLALVSQRLSQLDRELGDALGGTELAPENQIQTAKGLVADARQTIADIERFVVTRGHTETALERRETLSVEQAEYQHLIARYIRDYMSRDPQAYDGLSDQEIIGRLQTEISNIHDPAVRAERIREYEEILRAAPIQYTVEQKIRSVRGRVENQLLDRNVRERESARMVAKVYGSLGLTTVAANFATWQIQKLSRWLTPDEIEPYSSTDVVPWSPGFIQNRVIGAFYGGLAGGIGGGVLGRLRASRDPVFRDREALSILSTQDEDRLSADGARKHLRDLFSEWERTITSIGQRGLAGQREAALQLTTEIAEAEALLEWQAAREATRREPNESELNYHARVFTEYLRLRQTGSHLRAQDRLRNLHQLRGEVIRQQTWEAATNWAAWGAGVGALVPTMPWTPIHGYMMVSVRASLARAGGVYRRIIGRQHLDAERATRVFEQAHEHHGHTVHTPAHTEAVVLDSRVFSVGSQEVKNLEPTTQKSLEARRKMESEKLLARHGYFFLTETSGATGTEIRLLRLWPATLQRGIAHPPKPNPHFAHQREQARLADTQQITTGRFRVKEYDLAAMIAHYTTPDGQYKVDATEGSDLFLNEANNKAWKVLGREGQQLQKVDYSEVFVAKQLGDDNEYVSQYFVHPAQIGEFIAEFARIRNKMSAAEFIALKVRAERAGKKAVVSRLEEGGEWNVFIV